MHRDRWLEEGGRALRRLGFTKKGTTWRREDDRGIAVVNLQDSRYGPDFYLEVGIHRGGLATPKITDCLGRERIAHENRDVPEVVDEMMRRFEREYAAFERAAAARTPPPAPRERVRHAKFGAGSSSRIEARRSGWSSTTARPASSRDRSSRP